MADVVELVPGKTDKQIAEELKEKIIEAYKPFIEMLDEADKHGFNVVASVGKNAIGKYTIVQLQIMKIY